MFTGNYNHTTAVILITVITPPTMRTVIRILHWFHSQHYCAPNLYGLWPLRTKQSLLRSLLRAAIGVPLVADKLSLHHRVPTHFTLQNTILFQTQISRIFG